MNKAPQDNVQAATDRILRECEAVWTYWGDSASPHAELTSGRHSDGFIDLVRATSHTPVCERFAEGMKQLLEEHELTLSKDDWVIGSDHAAAAISHAVATAFGCRHEFTEKGPDGSQLWKRLEIRPGEIVLQVEDLVTTTGTLAAVRQGIRSGNPNTVMFAPFVMAVVHRSDVYDIEGAPILYLVHYDIQTWDPKECPLCAAGSKPLRPKQHWREFVGSNRT